MQKNQLVSKLICYIPFCGIFFQDLFLWSPSCQRYGFDECNKPTSPKVCNLGMHTTPRAALSSSRDCMKSVALLAQLYCLAPVFCKATRNKIQQSKLPVSLHLLRLPSLLTLCGKNAAILALYIHHFFLLERESANCKVDIRMHLMCSPVHLSLLGCCENRKPPPCFSALLQPYFFVLFLTLPSN